MADIDPKAPAPPPDTEKQESAAEYNGKDEYV